MKKIIVTGGAGFIGSALIRLLLAESDWRIINFDKLTYAGNLESLPGAEGNDRYSFVEGDIVDTALLQKVLEREQPDGIMHLAAESHVDRSIDGPGEFIKTNIEGTFRLLDVARGYWSQLDSAKKESFRFHHISTDEVYGSLGDTGLFMETTPYQPNSPYSASKAASDHLVRAWFHTYGLPVLITNCSNNYGPYQFPEKLIPLMILNGLEGKELPVYGKGENVRDWLYVEDHARALKLVFEKGELGRTYNIGGKNERQNIEVVQTICNLLDECAGPLESGPRTQLIKYVTDRPGHDMRYAIDTQRIESELGWQPRESFETGLRKTVEWYLKEKTWWKRVQEGSYRGERLGLGDQA